MKLRSIFYLNVQGIRLLGGWDHYPSEDEMRNALIDMYGSCTKLGERPIIFEVIKQNTFYQGDIQDLQEGE
ncbi:hypothetical protein [Bacillus sp. GG161]|uniref:hypothetical protein n=1 Tax=Bacillus sp. GG161 TaxID=2780507 RepID=UPI001C0D23C4|nr:hypothetical protein [Bacillus sp. GG161]MBU4617853.1 hypothetical protein [Bacillus sp. GG161]